MPFGIAQETKERIRKRAANPNEAYYMSEVHKVFSETLSGPGLDAMNARMLSRVALRLNAIEDALEVDKLWPWLQKLFTLATTFSMFGDHDPFTTDPSLFRCLW